MKKIFITLLMALSSLAISAYDFKVDGIYYNVVSFSDLTCNVTSGAEYTGNVTIPSTVTYNGRELTVVGIAQEAFSGCTSLTSVKIGNSVTSIGSYAFSGCTSLTSMKIGNSVTSIGGYAFYGCTSLTSVEIGNSVTSIGSYAFYDCTSLTSVVIPNSVTSIGYYAFYDCTSLASVKIGNSVSFADYTAFYKCTNIIKIEVGNTYGLEKMLYSCDYVKTLIVAEDYSDTSYPNMTYSNQKELDTIVCKLATPPTLPATFSNSQYLDLVVIVPTEALATYQAADVWKNFWNLQGGAENYTTGIEALPIENKNTVENVIYDICGRKLKTPQRGLNIINGRKVLVK